MLQKAHLFEEGISDPKRARKMQSINGRKVAANLLLVRTSIYTVRTAKLDRPGVTALGKLRQEDLHGFETRLGYTVLSQKAKKPNLQKPKSNDKNTTPLPNQNNTNKQHSSKI